MAFSRFGPGAGSVAVASSPPARPDRLTISSPGGAAVSGMTGAPAAPQAGFLGRSYTSGGGMTTTRYLLALVLAEMTAMALLRRFFRTRHGG